MDFCIFELSFEIIFDDNVSLFVYFVLVTNMMVLIFQIVNFNKVSSNI